MIVRPSLVKVQTRICRFLSFLIILSLSVVVASCLVNNQRCRTRRGIVKCLLDHSRLNDFPSGLPANTGALDASFNCIRNLTHIPPLDNLYTLTLTSNRITTVSWTSLRQLPSLEYLYLSANRIYSVNLGAVIQHLPKLKHIDVSKNRLTSISANELGLPAKIYANIDKNPFSCSCAITWLTNKVKCLKECDQSRECCFACEACFLESKLEEDSLVCASPANSKKIPFEKFVPPLEACDSTTTSIQTAGVRERVTATSRSFAAKLPEADKTSTDTQRQSGMFKTSTPVAKIQTVVHMSTQKGLLQTDNFAGSGALFNTTLQDGKINAELNFVHIIINASAVLLGVLFILLIARKIIMIRRNRGSEDDVNIITTVNGVPLDQIRPPIQNTTYESSSSCIRRPLPELPTVASSTQTNGAVSTNRETEGENISEHEYAKIHDYEEIN